MNEDTIKVKVNENGQWTEYSLTFEEYAYIQPFSNAARTSGWSTSTPTTPNRLRNS